MQCPRYMNNRDNEIMRQQLIAEFNNEIAVIVGRTDRMSDNVVIEDLKLVDEEMELVCLTNDYKVRSQCQV